MENWWCCSLNLTVTSSVHDVNLSSMPLWHGTTGGGLPCQLTSWPLQSEGISAFTADMEEHILYPDHAHSHSLDTCLLFICAVSTLELFTQTVKSQKSVKILLDLVWYFGQRLHMADKHSIHCKNICLLLWRTVPVDFNLNYLIWEYFCGLRSGQSSNQTSFQCDIASHQHIYNISVICDLFHQHISVKTMAASTSTSWRDAHLFYHQQKVDRFCICVLNGQLPMSSGTNCLILSSVFSSVAFTNIYSFHQVKNVAYGTQRFNCTPWRQLNALSHLASRIISQTLPYIDAATELTSALKKKWHHPVAVLFIVIHVDKFVTVNLTSYSIMLNDVQQRMASTGASMQRDITANIIAF